MSMFNKPAPKAPAASGVEIMLRSLGIGPVLDTLKTLAESGVFDKIVSFADSVERLEKKLDYQAELLERLLHERERKNVVSDSDPVVIVRGVEFNVRDFDKTGTD